MKKALYIIPGFGESSKEKAYREIAKAAKTAGYTPVFHVPTWSRTTATGWIREFKEKLARDKAGDVSVLGFSFGAYIAVNTARDFHFKNIFACSLSPYFKEDLKNIPPLAWKSLGIRRRNDFEKFTFPKDLNSNIVFFVGEKESDRMLKSTEKYYASCLGKKKRLIVPGARHDLNSEDYLQAVLNELTKAPTK